MAIRTMREVQASEIPLDGGTAVQEDPSRPVFRGQGADDWVCVTCATVLAAGMDAQYMTRRVRIKCATCKTINVSAEVPFAPARRPRRGS